MKRIIAMVCMILSFSVLTASADTIVIPVQVAGAQYAGEHVGPAGANLDGVAIVGGITCLDYNVTTYIPNPGFTVAIETLDPLNLTNARFYSAADPDGSLLMYQEAAWLNTQLHLIADSTVIGEIQFAIWRIFNPTASSGASADNVNAENAWMALAGNGNGPSSQFRLQFGDYLYTGRKKSGVHFGRCGIAWCSCWFFGS